MNNERINQHFKWKINNFILITCTLLSVNHTPSTSLLLGFNNLTDKI